MKFVPTLIIALAAILNPILSAEEVSFHELKPMMVVPKDVVLKNDFSKEEDWDKTKIRPVQETQWKVADGLLHGTESTKEYQAQKPDHNGASPMLDIPVTPYHYLATFSVRFIGGKENKNNPQIQFGHHIGTMRLLPGGSEILADHEAVKVAAAPDFKLVDNQWYHVMVEVKGDEILVQFANGPVFYAKHPSLAEVPKSGKKYLGFVGNPEGGVIQIDELNMWTVEETEKKEWAETRAKLPVFEHVDAKPGKKKKEPKQK